MKYDTILLLTTVALTAQFAAGQDIGAQTDASSLAPSATVPATTPAVTAIAPASRPNVVENWVVQAKLPSGGQLRWPLAAAPQAIKDYSLEEMVQFWPKLNHEPFATAGFNGLMLPFLYRDREGLGNPNEAFAASFLLSSLLDWAPGCYCARHAYFVFKRSADQIKPLTRRYDPKSIAQLIEGWDATHAVGGELVRSKEGYSGTLMIYSRNGQLALKKHYAEPREYFQILGDMCVDAMKFFDYEPTEEMVKEVHRVRCKSASLAALGSAAFAQEKTKDEFGIYEKILQDDPGFAEVRYWWSNQTMWSGRSVAEYNRQKAISLQSCLTPGSLFDFDPDQCPDKSLAANYQQWLEQGEKLIGAPHPHLIEIRLKSFNKADKPVPSELLEQATKLAARYPNSYYLLLELAKAYAHGVGPADCDMAAALCLQASRSRYLTGQGDKYHARKNYAWHAMYAGRYDLAIPDLRRLQAELKDLKNRRDDYAWASMLLGRCFFSVGRIPEATEAYRLAYRNNVDVGDAQTEAIVMAGCTAVMVGDNTAASQIMDARGKELAEAYNPVLLAGYAAFGRGEPVDFKAVYTGRKDKPWRYDWYVLEVQLLGQVFTMTRNPLGRKQVEEYLRCGFSRRPLWLALDAYDRWDPQPQAACMYEAAEWLHPDDLWMLGAAADFRQRQPNLRVPSADELLATLKDYSPDRYPAYRENLADASYQLVQKLPPGAVECQIARLIQRREFAKAEELALRYCHLATDHRDFVFRAHANHVYYLLQQAKEKAKAASQPVKTPQPKDRIPF